MAHANMAAWFQQQCNGVVITNGTHRLDWDWDWDCDMGCAVLWNGTGMFNPNPPFFVFFHHIETGGAK
jgi:hypothetical protein